VTCPTGKRPHPTRAHARAFARRHPHGRRRAYACPICGAWHLGRLTTAQRRTGNAP
jgi:hypothetical protein